MPLVTHLFDRGAISLKEYEKYMLSEIEYLPPLMTDEEKLKEYCHFNSKSYIITKHGLRCSCCNFKVR